MGAAPILEHAEDAKTPHRILVRSLLKSRNKLRAKYRELQKDCKRLRNQVAAVERSRDMWRERERARAKEAKTCSVEATQSIVESQSQELPKRSEQRGHEFAQLSAPLTAPHGAEKRGR
jgi:predicted  nucleic acid-binding Zn-ribbon protein